MTQVTNIRKSQSMVYRIDGNDPEGKQEIPGKVIPVFIHNVGKYFYTEMEVYKDGKIAAWGSPVEFEELKNLIKKGWIVTTIPDDAEIEIGFYLKCNIKNATNYIKEEEFIKEVHDIIEDLNDRPTSSQICRNIYKEYVKNPSAKLKKELKIAYYNVPEHLRDFLLGDMDDKDHAIKKIIK